MSRADREAREREAKRSLDEMRDSGEVLGTSQFARQADRARRHFGGADADPDDRIEIWGRRIGRALSLIAVFALAIYLAVTYL